jgi:DNA-binding HxlR family transcriptional regulator
VSKVPDSSCSIARSLGVLGERWTFLILREAFSGLTRFGEFRDSLGIAPDTLTDRLGTLVTYGVMEKVAYQELGERARSAYVLTPAGRELIVVLAALQQWGDEHLPWPDGPSVLRRVRDSDRAVHIGFVDDRGQEVAQTDVAMIRTGAYPG